MDATETKDAVTETNSIDKNDDSIKDSESTQNDLQRDDMVTKTEDDETKSNGVTKSGKRKSRKKTEPRKLKPSSTRKMNRSEKSIFRELKIGGTQNSISGLGLSRFVRELGAKYSMEGIRFKRSALDMIHSVCESELISIFTACSKAASRADRITVFPDDMRFVLELGASDTYKQYVRQHPTNTSIKKKCERLGIDVKAIQKMVVDIVDSF